jgi:hypothetical protein
MDYRENEPKIEKLFQKIEREIPEKIDTSKFSPLSTEELLEILGLTVKRDEENKLITFLCQLSAYTESSQFNISFNAPSSTGKSYIPLEISQLFPKEDVIKIGYCSPTAFFHQVGKYLKEKGGYLVDLSRKILIFLDQPHSQLLSRLRPLLSHDEKEIESKITDKSEKHGLRTKNVIIKGFPSVIFCTAGLKVDEQEATRFILLSPEINQEKIREAIYEKLKKEADEKEYKRYLEEDQRRKLLKERVLAIRQERIQEIKLGRSDLLKEMFFERYKVLKPKHQRDIGKIISLIKSQALLNLWFREKEEKAIIASEEDIKEAFRIWDKISESQELSLPPYVYDIYFQIILPAFKEKGVLGEEIKGLTRKEIIQKHFQIHKRYLSQSQLSREIIPMLEMAGLIYQEMDPEDRRRMLIYCNT